MTTPTLEEVMERISVVEQAPTRACPDKCYRARPRAGTTPERLADVLRSAGAKIVRVSARTVQFVF